MSINALILVPYITLSLNPDIPVDNKLDNLFPLEYYKSITKCIFIPESLEGIYKNIRPARVKLLTGGRDTPPSRQERILPHPFQGKVKPPATSIPEDFPVITLPTTEIEYDTRPTQ